MRKKIRIFGVMVLMSLCLQLTAFGADKTFFIKGSNITRGGSLLSSTTDIQFFLNNWTTTLTLTEVGGAALSSPITITSGQVEAPTDAGRNVQYSNAAIGQTLNAVIWSGGIGANNYYLKITLPMNEANYSNSSLTWLWDGLAVDYKAVAPYQPVIDYFEDSTTAYTDGTPASVTLKAHSVAGSGTDGLREVSTYNWKWWVPADSNSPGNDEPGGNGTAGSTVLSLSSAQVTAGVTYAFRVAYGNQWSGVPGTWSNIQIHKAGGAVAETTQTWTLLLNTTGINTIAIPFITTDFTNKPVKHGTPPPTDTKIDTNSDNKISVNELISAINTQITPAKVTVFGWWTANNQKHVGLTSVKDPIAQSLYTGADAVGDVNGNGTVDINDILSSPIVINQPYQVSVDVGGKSFALKGYKQ